MPALEKGEYLRLLAPAFVGYQLGERFGLDLDVRIAGYWVYPTTPDGDIDTATATPRETIAPVFVPADIVPLAGEAICASIGDLRARGVRVIGTPPNPLLDAVAIPAYAAFLAKVRDFFVGCGAEFVSPAGDGVYPRTAFLDTQYHLTAAGREERSRDLAAALCVEAIDCRP